MTLRSIATVLAGAAVALCAGCSSDAEGRPGGGSGSDAGTDAKPSDAESDAKSDAKPDAASSCLSVEGKVFAVDTLYFGDMDWDGNLDPDAWTLFGRDVDGVQSTATSTGLCQPADGAVAADVYPDGDDGIDNAFGKSVLPLLGTVSTDFTDRVNGSILNGSFTWLLKIDPVATSASPVTTMVYAADSRTSPPAFDGTDCWPVAPASLADPPDFESANVVFDDGAIVANRLSTGSPGDLELSVPISGTVLTLTAHHARIVIELEDDPNVPTRGVISGVLDTEEFIEEARDVLGFLDPTMCAGPAFEAVASAIRKTSDIMKDGTQDPASTCDGISVGIGFTMGRAGFSGLGSATPAGTDPCP